MYQTNKLLEVKLLVEPNVIKETLSRMGIVDKKNKIIYMGFFGNIGQAKSVKYILFSSA